VLLTWGAGVTTPQAFGIAILNDAFGAGDAPVETLLLALQNPINITNGGNPPALGTSQAASVDITDGDAAGEITFTSAAYGIGENAGSVDLLVTRTGGTLGAASVVVSVTGGSAVGGGVDFNDLTPVPYVVSWADGFGGPMPVTVTVLDDAATTGDLTVTFGLGAAQGAVLGAQDTATLTIADDETIPPAGEITISVSANPAFESAGPVTLVFTRQNGTAGTVSVTVTTTDLTATSVANPSAKQDFVAVNQVLTWGPGTGGSQNVAITIKNNDGTAGQTGDAFGAAETFRVNASVTTATGGIVTPLPIDITITDD
jgi:hypothetical protein